MRLIDADALNERMYHDAFEADSDMQKWDSGCWIRYKMFERAIEDAPTIKERKKGTWEQIKGRDGYIDFRCSACHKYRFHNGAMRKEYKFCPNCGADMREEQDGRSL